MMICTVRFSKKKAVAILLAIAIILAAVILAMPERGTGSDAAGASGAVRTEEDQAAYLGSLGYQVELPLASLQKAVRLTLCDLIVAAN